MPGWGDPPAAEARAIGATCGGVRIWSLYVPNGRALDDPHMVYKLDWLAPAARRRAGAGSPTDPRASRCSATGTSRRRTTTSGTWPTSRARPTSRRAERAAFQAVLDAGFIDVVRPHTPGPGIYTYWDYTAAALPEAAGHADRLRARLTRRSPRGSTGAAIDREERKGKGATDHAPVVVDLADH